MTCWNATTMRSHPGSPTTGCGTGTAAATTPATGRGPAPSLLVTVIPSTNEAACIAAASGLAVLAGYTVVLGLLAGRCFRWE
jgi:hypothetical protein